MGERIEETFLYILFIFYEKEKKQKDVLLAKVASHNPQVLRAIPHFPEHTLQPLTLPSLPLQLSLHPLLLQFLLSFQRTFPFTEAQDCPPPWNYSKRVALWKSAQNLIPDCNKTERMVKRKPLTAQKKPSWIVERDRSERSRLGQSIWIF